MSHRKLLSCVELHWGTASLAASFGWTPIEHANTSPIHIRCTTHAEHTLLLHNSAHETSFMHHREKTLVTSSFRLWPTIVYVVGKSCQKPTNKENNEGKKKLPRNVITLNLFTFLVSSEVSCCIRFLSHVS